MLYLSQIRNQRIWDAFGRPLGRCDDLLAASVDEPFPLIRAIVIRDGDQAPQYLDMAQVSSLYPSIILSVPTEQIRSYAPIGNELRLGTRVLDCQIVDTEGRRVVRVNDVQIARIRERYCLTGVDIGGSWPAPPSRPGGRHTGRGQSLRQVAAGRCDPLRGRRPPQRR